MKSLLVIDDSAEDRELVRIAIGTRYAVEDASDAYAGLILAHKGQYAVILLDLILQPPIVPAEFVAQLHTASPRSAIVVFSGTSNPIQIGEAFVAGIDGLVQKPTGTISTDYLLASLEAAIIHRQLTPQP